MILVSACLLGENCKYSGGNNDCPAVRKYLEGKEYILFCPEQAGGLPTPRPPAERQGDKVVSSAGSDVTAAFCRGAGLALERCLSAGVTLAILKESSPSCGSHTVYDGTFTGRKIPGMGVTAQLLNEHNIPVISEADLAE